MVTDAAHVLDGACLLTAVIWLYLLLGHGRYWRTDVRLPGAARPGAEAGPRRAGLPGSGPACSGPACSGPACSGPAWPAVTAIVPARDEADVLPFTLPTLLGQDYPGALTVIVVDDGSTDGTGTIAERLGEKSAAEPPGERSAGPRLRVVPGKPRPAGWAGKVWAMHQGLEELASLHARAGSGTPDALAGQDGGFVLFTDADVAWDRAALRGLVTAAERDNRDLVSQMVLLRARSGWERLLVPAFVYFFAQLYPFRWVGNPARRAAAAAGGCMLVRRRVLELSGGLTPIAGALIDDVALGTLVKARPPGRIWLGLTRRITSVRPYPGLSGLWAMVARSAYTQLRYRPLLLAGTVLGLLLTYLLPPAGLITGLVTGQPVAAASAGLAWAVMALSYLPMLRWYRLPPGYAVLLPFIAALYTAMTVDSARRHYRGRGGEWKGRAGIARERASTAPRG